MMMMMKWNGVQLCVICEPKDSLSIMWQQQHQQRVCNENNNYSVHIRKAVDSLYYYEWNWTPFCNLIRSFFYFIFFAQQHQRERMIWLQFLSLNSISFFTKMLYIQKPFVFHSFFISLHSTIIIIRCIYKDKLKEIACAKSFQKGERERRKKF